MKTMANRFPKLSKRSVRIEDWKSHNRKEVDQMPHNKMEEQPQPTHISWIQQYLMVTMSFFQHWYFDIPNVSIYFTITIECFLK